MKIASVALAHIDLSQKDTSWRIARGTIAATLTTVIRLETDSGLVGYGAAPIGAQLLSGESHASVGGFLRAARPCLVGADPRMITPTMAQVGAVMAGNARAKAGIEFALYDLAGRALGVSVATLLGGVVRREIPVLRIVAIAAPETMADRVAELAAAGFHTFKLKLAGDRLDIDRVAAVRDRIGTAAHLTVDANQAYSVAGAVALLAAIERYDIDMAEQPVAADDFEGLAMVRAKSRIPVLADEAIRTLGDALRLIQLRAADMLSIKLGHLGGIGTAVKLAHLCEAASIGCLVGANTGGRLVEAAHMQFIAATPAIAYGCEVGEFYRLAYDPTGVLECRDGMLHLPEGPGLGATPDRSVDFVEVLP